MLVLSLLRLLSLSLRLVEVVAGKHGFNTCCPYPLGSSSKVAGSSTAAAATVAVGLWCCPRWSLSLTTSCGTVGSALC